MILYGAGGTGRMEKGEMVQQQPLEQLQYRYRAAAHGKLSVRTVGQAAALNLMTPHGAGDLASMESTAMVTQLVAQLLKLFPVVAHGR